MALGQEELHEAVPLDQAAAAHEQFELLIREARRRQRRRRLAALMVVVAAAGTYLIARTAAGSRSHPKQETALRRVVGAPAPIPRNVGTTLLMWPAGYPAFGPGGGPSAYVDDLSTGRLTESEQPAIGSGDFQPLATLVGRWLLYVGDGAVNAIRDDLTGRPRVLATTPFLAPAAAPGRVWLFKVGHGMRGSVRVWTIRAWTEAPSGGRPSRPITLPAGATLPAVRGTDAGLLLQLPQGLALWNPGGGAPRSLPSSSNFTDGFDATSRLVAYGTSCTTQVTAQNAAQPNAGYDTCKALQVLDIVTGKLVSFPAPAGTGGWVPAGFNLVSAISHDDRMIAAYAALRPQTAGQVRLYVMQTAGLSRRAKLVPSSVAYLFARTAWSANDTWLLYQGPAGHLWAYQVTSGQTRASSTPCCQYTVMVAAPSRSG
jgi:hypothetical protein